MATGNEQTNIIVDQLIALLTKGNAHVTLEEALEGLSFENAGKKPGGLPYSIWKILEHIRITQLDILNFSTNENYKALRWPDEYWPKEDAPANDEILQQSIKQIFKDRDSFINLIREPAADLYTPFVHGDGQNLLREAMLIADHNSYHLGEIIVLRRLLNNWK